MDGMRQFAQGDDPVRQALRALDGLPALPGPCDTCAAMDKDVERQHLQQADRHVTEARQRIAAQEALIASGRLAGEELEEAMALLRSMHRTLGEFEQHRDVIARMLGDLERGPP